MLFQRILLTAGLLSCALTAHADASLSCRIHDNRIQGAAKVPRTTDFVWSAAHGADEATGPIRTSIGRIDQGVATGPATVITLNGRPLQLPAALRGSVRFGRSIDYGDKVALAYLVERGDDSSASPSQVVLLLGPGGAVLETDLLRGTAAEPGNHCLLVD